MKHLKQSLSGLVSCVLSLLCVSLAQAQNSNLQLQPVLTGLSSPVLVTNARDGRNRLFIVEQTGKIKVLQPGATTATEFLNIQSKIVSGGERGLLGLAFHPQFKMNRRFFVNYTRASDGATVIAEYHASANDPNIADTTETVLLTIAQPFANHNGGMVEFGPDGFLYIGMGDGGSANDPGNRAQNVNELLGKMLRIDVDHANGGVPYSSPASNPFFGNIAGLDEIFAVGLRNPWRFSFDRVTGQLYAGDVGQGAREEVDIITLGGNYGWRIFEGTRCTNNDPTLCTPGNFIAPILEYDHTNGRCSITGGYVYRGARQTLPLGTYVYSDYCTGEIFTAANGSSSVLLTAGGSVSSLGEDEAGEIYVVIHSGTISRLVNSNSPSLVTSVSAANYDSQIGVAAESLVTAFGTGLATTTAPATSTPLPTTLGGVTVTVRDGSGIERLAPLYYVSPTQINFAVPANSATGFGAIVVTSNGQVVSSGAVRILPTAPGIFSADSTGSGLAAALVQRIIGENSTFEPVVQYNASNQTFSAIPIDLGSETDLVYLNLFGTGIRNRSNLSAVTATVGGISVNVSYAGAQGQYEGLDQLNLLLPKSLRGRGDVNVVVTVDGQTANTVRVKIM